MRTHSGCHVWVESLKGLGPSEKSASEPRCARPHSATALIHPRGQRAVPASPAAARGLPAQARLPAVLSPGCQSVFTSTVFESLQPVTGDHQISLTTGTELSFKLLKK